MRKLFIYLPVIVPIVLIIVIIVVVSINGTSYIVKREIDPNKSTFYSSSSDNYFDDNDVNYFTELNEDGKIEFINPNYGHRQIGKEYNSILPSKFEGNELQIFTDDLEFTPGYIIPNYAYQVEEGDITFNDSTYTIDVTATTIEFKQENSYYESYINYEMFNELLMIYDMKNEDELVILSPDEQMQIVSMSDKVTYHEHEYDITYYELIEEGYIISKDGTLIYFEGNESSIDITDYETKDVLFTCESDYKFEYDSIYIVSENERVYYPILLSYDYEDQYLACADTDEPVFYDLNTNEQFESDYVENAYLIDLEGGSNE